MLFMPRPPLGGAGQLAVDYYPRRPLSAEDSENFIIISGRRIVVWTAPHAYRTPTKNRKFLSPNY